MTSETTLAGSHIDSTFLLRFRYVMPSNTNNRENVSLQCRRVCTVSRRAVRVER